MVENKMAVAKIFNFDEAKAMARKHATLHPEPSEVLWMLDQFDDRYDYIFEILHHEMLAGDMPTSSKSKNLHQIVSNIQDGNYRVVRTN